MNWKIPFTIIFTLFFVEISQAQFQSEIIPFERVNQITPGVTTYKEVQALLGEPKKIKKTKKEKVAEVKIGGNKIIMYPDLGIEMLFSGSKIEPDSIVDSVTVEAPFSGKSPNGLYVGMPQSDAVSILMKDYSLELHLRNVLFFAKEKGMDDDFQVWFDKGKLIRMKIFRK